MLKKCPHCKSTIEKKYVNRITYVNGGYRDFIKLIPKKSKDPSLYKTRVPHSYNILYVCVRCPFSVSSEIIDKTYKRIIIK